MPSESPSIDHGFDHGAPVAARPVPGSAAFAPIVVALCMDRRADLSTLVHALQGILADLDAHAAGTLGEHSHLAPASDVERTEGYVRRVWVGLVAELGEVSVLDGCRYDLEEACFV